MDDRSVPRCTLSGPILVVNGKWSGVHAFIKLVNSASKSCINYVLRVVIHTASQECWIEICAFRMDKRDSNATTIKEAPEAKDDCPKKKYMPLMGHPWPVTQTHRISAWCTSGDVLLLSTFNMYTVIWRQKQGSQMTSNIKIWRHHLEDGHLAPACLLPQILHVLENPQHEFDYHLASMAPCHKQAPCMAFTRCDDMTRDWHEWVSIILFEALPDIPAVQHNG